MTDFKPQLSIVRRTASAGPTDAHGLLGEKELAALLAVSRSTLQSWRYSGKGPRYIKVGRLIRYRSSDVDAFLLAGTQGATSDEEHCL